LLMINDFRGFYDFGLISGMGLWIIFIVYFVFLPSLLIFLEKIRLLRIQPLPTEKEHPLKFKKSWMKPSLIVMALLTLFSFGAAPFLKFEFDSKKIRADIPEVRLAKQKQRMTIHRVNNPAAVVIYSREEADALTEAVEEKIQQDKISPTLDTSRSYYDLVPPDQGAKLKVLAQIRKLLSDPTIKLVKGEQKVKLDHFKAILAEAKAVDPKEVPSEVTDLFRGKPQIPGQLFYINAIPQLELDDGANAMRFADDIATLKTKKGTYYPASDAVVFGLVLSTMLRDSKKVLIISLFSIAFFVFLDFRDWKKSGIVLLSIVLGVLWLLGIMWLFKIKFNFYNIIIIPAVMGMSIDNSIHIYHRYEELGRGSLQKVLSSTGVAAMLASLTNASGFFGLLFCTHRGLYSIGLLAVIGVATCLISTLVFLPMLLQFLEHIQYDRKPVTP
ncbi:MAG: MMPL family transporter, partial [Deltaproteobacteria bacterium]|nr:MMPL family transporter [Deltaproteobacteria bacterium]